MQFFYQKNIVGISYYCKVEKLICILCSWDHKQFYNNFIYEQNLLFQIKFCTEIDFTKIPSDKQRVNNWFKVIVEKY